MKDETWHVTQEFQGGGRWIVHQADLNRNPKIAYCDSESDARRIAAALNEQDEAVCQAIAEEREACAKLAEDLFPRVDGAGWLSQDMRRATAKAVADAIRARGNA